MDEPILTPEDVESYRAELKALQAGQIKGVVDSPFWQRVALERSRRQANAQISAANSMKRATWLIAVFTALLFAATVLPLIARCPLIARPEAPARRRAHAGWPVSYGPPVIPDAL